VSGLLVVVACGHGPPAAPPPPTITLVARAIDAPPPEPDAPKPLDDDPPRLAAREVQLYDDLAAALAAAGSDCDAAAAKITALVDANAAYEKISHAGGDARDRLRAALAPYRDHLDATLRDVASSHVMHACARHAEFTAAIERLRGET